EEDRRDQQPDSDDRGAGAFTADVAGEAGAGVTGEHGARDHDQRRRPVDRTAGDEVGRGHAVDAQVEEVLEAVHGVDVGEPEEAEHRESEDADAGAEVAAVDGDGELEEDGGYPTPSREMRLTLCLCRVLP